MTPAIVKAENAKGNPIGHLRSLLKTDITSNLEEVRPEPLRQFRPEGPVHGTSLIKSGQPKLGGTTTKQHLGCLFPGIFHAWGKTDY